MRSRNLGGISGASLAALAVGAAAGAAIGLLVAPMRGSDMRANLRQRAADGGTRLQSIATTSRDWASRTMDRGLSLVEEGRRALRTRPAPDEPLSASVGEIAAMHEGSFVSSREVTS